MKTLVHILNEGIHKKNANYDDFDLGGNIALYYWRLDEDIDKLGKNRCPNGNLDNLGDYLSRVVVCYYQNKFVSESIWSTVPHSKRTLYAIGSILGYRCQDAVVWGSGLIKPGKSCLLRLRFSKLDIRSVRGPNTRAELLKLGKVCPEVYGDPAILMPEIYQPQCTQKEYNVSLVLHYMENSIAQTDTPVNTIEIITSDYRGFIDQIVRSSRVISSSLHGIILAEAYGVPAVLMLPEEADQFKYRDYYYSTGRYEVKIAHTLQEALETEPMPLPDLDNMRKQLLDAFPVDLWI